MVETAEKVNGFSIYHHAHGLTTTGFRIRLKIAAMIVQIYEIQTPRQAQSMVDLDVDHVGSVLISKENWMDPSIKEVVQTVQAAGRKSCLIPLFNDIDLISQALTYYRPDIVHFCETLPPIDEEAALTTILDRQKIIGKRFNTIEIMRAIPIGQKGHGDIVPSLQLAKVFEPVSNWFLTDTLLAPNNGAVAAEQPVCGYVGITGITCDWQVARQLVARSAIPVILAGGIGPENVVEAIMQTQPAGVDSCTQTNAFDNNGKAIRFKKDLSKVRTMVQRAKRNGFER